MSSNEAIVIERTYPVTMNRVWNAITHPDEMKLWYFDLPDFKPEPGCRISVYGRSFR